MDLGLLLANVRSGKLNRRNGTQAGQTTGQTETVVPTQEDLTHHSVLCGAALDGWVSSVLTGRYIQDSSRMRGGKPRVSLMMSGAQTQSQLMVSRMSNFVCEDAFQITILL